MGGTVVELEGVKPSGKGIPAHDLIQVNMDSGEAFSEPILLAGRKVVSLQALTLSATDITIQGTNFSSRTTRDANADYRDGLLIPLAADFVDLHDKLDAAIKIIGTTGDKIWAFSEAGFPIWIRIFLSVAQTETLYVGAKG